ncbi:MAG: efflux RND transporter periplasmic adaptor subunit [Campylobacterales bacterium]
MSSKKTKIIYVVLPIIIIIGGFFVAKMLVQTAPKAKEKSKSRLEAVTFVDTATFEKQDHNIVIKTTGRVEPSTKSSINAEVSAKVVYVSPKLKPGEKIKKGELLLKLDDSNYKAILDQKEAALKSAEANLELELGKVKVAKKELELLNTVIPDANSTLALREPQLRSVKAALRSAKADLEKAKLDIQRCSIKAPFSGVVESKDVSLGAYVGTNTKLLSLVAVDKFWIEADVFEEELQYIDFGETKALISPLWLKGSKEGVVLNYLPTLEPSTQKGRVLIELPSPLSGDNPIFAGSYVDISIIAKKIENITKLPWDLVRSNQSVWVARDGKLVKKPLKSIYKGESYIYVENIEPDEQIITTNLNSPAEGIKIKVQEASE